MEKPAIILITCDELNKDVLGYCGGQAVTTPYIDSLAESGTNYENCYTLSPWCLPARCSIMTGLYPHNSGAYSNFRKCALNRNIDNLFFAMKDAGYLKAYRDAVWNRTDQKVFPFPGPEEWHPDAWTGRKAVDFIRGYDGKKPLFTWVSFSGPHYVFDAPEEYLKQVDVSRLPAMRKKEGEFDSRDRIHHDSYFGGENANIDGCVQADDHACKNYTPEYWDQLRTSYCANVKLIDDQVGEILQAVQERYGENALVISPPTMGKCWETTGYGGSITALMRRYGTFRC